MPIRVNLDRVLLQRRMSLTELADRVGVMARGRIVAEFDQPADRQQVGQAMVAHD